MPIGLAAGSSHPHHFYRPPKQISWELSQHAGVFLGSGQYIEGLNLLTNLLTAGTAISTQDTHYPALLPPMQHLAVVATLIVHPSLTRKSKSSDSILASNEALNYLRLVNNTVGPINARFADAFIFATSGSPRRTGRWRNETSSVSSENEKPIQSDLANRTSLWNKAHDFWHAAGWAFNCSVKHKQRWDRWRLWLELMVDIMEDDWAARLIIQQQSVERGHAIGEDGLQQSIIMRYVTAGGSVPLTSSRWTRIVHAILADGSPETMNEFKEVFKSETAERKQVSPSRQKSKKDIHPFDLDLDDGENEDDDGEADIEFGSTRDLAKHAASARKPSIALLDGSSEDDDDVTETRRQTGAGRLGGIDSVRLRERLLVLLASFAETDLQSFDTREVLFDTFVKRLGELHISSFAAFIANSRLSPTTHVIFCCRFLLKYLPGNSPTYDVEPPTQEDLVKHFLALPANSGSCVANAKVSILLQSILQHMLPMLKATKELTKAVNIGVESRNQKVSGYVKKRKNGTYDADEDEAQDLLDMSADFLNATVDAIAQDSSRKIPKRHESTPADPFDISLTTGSALSSAPSEAELSARGREVGIPRLVSLDSSGLSSAPSETELNARGRGLGIASSGISPAHSTADLDAEERELGYP